uniref:AsIV-cont00034-ORF1 n=1 Tax=Apophua simplicipes ichnovirus TaxID=1329648 RepID=S5DMI0_9VIRU|nr:AsIV-cont00034-ORF1 [Apophua simplicipes ichnovirus]
MQAFQQCIAPVCSVLIQLEILQKIRSFVMQIYRRSKGIQFVALFEIDAHYRLVLFTNSKQYEFCSSLSLVQAYSSSIYSVLTLHYITLLQQYCYIQHCHIQHFRTIFLFYFLLFVKYHYSKLESGRR